MEFLPANNEFHSAEQRINNGNRPSAKNIAMAADGPHIWSLTSLLDKLIKIGAEVVSHGRYVRFQMAELATPRSPDQYSHRKSRHTGGRPVPIAEIGPGPLFSARGRLRREDEERRIALNHPNASMR